MGVKLMVSIWPTAAKDAENYEETVDKGLLVKNARGIRVQIEGHGYTAHFDATNEKE